MVKLHLALLTNAKSRERYGLGSYCQSPKMSEVGLLDMRCQYGTLTDKWFTIILQAELEQCIIIIFTFYILSCTVAHRGQRNSEL